MRLLGDAEIVNHIYRIENVATQPAERITANDEERQRQGYELQTTFEWAVRDQLLDVRSAITADSEGEILNSSYGSGATISRLNKGLRRRADRTQFGFRIDPGSGYWEKSKDESTEPTDPAIAARQWIVPIVQDRKNALLVRTVGRRAQRQSFGHRPPRAASWNRSGLSTGRRRNPRRAHAHAWTSGMASCLYEATEGGAGVLTRLVAEPERLAEVAVRAWIMHFDVKGAATLPIGPDALVDAPDTSCVAGCYRCVMSYYNQPDHELLDRRDHDAKALLLRLARATTLGAQRPASLLTDSLPESEQDPKLVRWLAAMRERKLPLPDAEPLALEGTQVPVVWRVHYLVALLDEPSTPVVAQIEGRGFEVVRFVDDESTWQDSFDRLAGALGRSQ